MLIHVLRKFAAIFCIIWSVILKQCHILLNKQYAFLCYLALALALDRQMLMCQTDNKNKTFCIQLNYMIM